jgi:putative hydrolase of the HAD superfamily
VGRKQYVFFDVDHTLVQRTVSLLAAFVRAARETGVSATREQAAQALEVAYSAYYYGDCIRRHCRRGDEDAFWLDYDGHILELMGVTEGLEQATQNVVEALEDPGGTRLYPEVREVLESLAASGVRLGVVTNRPRAEPHLSRFGIAHYFNPMIDAFSAGCSKDEGRMFDMAAAVAAEAACTGWYVGDSYEEDVQGARAARLRPVLVDREGRCEGSDCERVEDLRGLLSVLRVGEGEGHR